MLIPLFGMRVPPDPHPEQRDQHSCKTRGGRRGRRPKSRGTAQGTAQGTALGTAPPKPAWRCHIIKQHSMLGKYCSLLILMPAVMCMAQSPNFSLSLIHI